VKEIYMFRNFTLLNVEVNTGDKIGGKTSRQSCIIGSMALLDFNPSATQTSTSYNEAKSENQVIVAVHEPHHAHVGIPEEHLTSTCGLFQSDP
jgi:hypothetical protein